MAARHLSQAGSVFPLKQLTQEQVAQVQQQIQTSNQFQSNLQASASLPSCQKPNKLIISLDCLDRIFAVELHICRRLMLNLQACADLAQS